MTDSSNQAVGFSFLPVAWSLGSIAGPIIGGYASNPSKRYPEIFGNIELFKSFPYLLPCMIAGITPALGMIVGAYFLNETLPSKSRKELLNSVANGVGASHEEEVDHLEPTPFRELYTATIFKVLFT
jgi:MFS family permease